MSGAGPILSVRGPRVSVCIPTYNYARFVGRAIESVLAQEFEDFELIIADNASTDDTPDVVAAYRDARVRAVRHSRNLGLFGNFNACLALARGEFVKFVCADDWIAPDYLGETLELFARYPDLGLVSAPTVLVDAMGQPVGRVDAGFTESRNSGSAALAVLAAHYNVIGTPSSVILRTRTLRELGGFDADLAPASDLAIWLAVLAHQDAGWAVGTCVYQRLHETKSHDYEPDTSDAVFRAWSALESSVSSDILRQARQAEGERFVAVALRLALHDRRAARAVLRTVARNVDASRFAARMVTRLPRLLRHQWLRAVARRRGLMLVYDPSLRFGEHRHEL